MRYESQELYPGTIVPPALAVPWAGYQANRPAPETGPDGFPLYPEDPLQPYHRHINEFLVETRELDKWNIVSARTGGGAKLLAGDARARGLAILAATARAVWHWKAPKRDEARKLFIYKTGQYEDFYPLLAELFHAGFELTPGEVRQLIQINTGPLDYIFIHELPVLGTVMAVEQVAAAGPMHLDFQKDARRLLRFLLHWVESRFHQHWASDRILAGGGNPVYFDMDNNRAAFKRLLALLPGDDCLRDLAAHLIHDYSQPHTPFNGGPALRTFLDLAAGGTMPETLRADLVKIQQFMAGARLNKEDSKSAGRIYAMLAGGAAPAIEPGEAWSDAANASLKQMASDLAARWVKLMVHCAAAESAKPSKKWSKLADELLAEVGPAEFKQRVLEWFPLVAKPRTVHREAQHPDSQPDPDLLFTDRNATILKGLVWCCAGVKDVELSRALSELAEVCFKKSRWLGARCPRVGNACLYSLSSTASEESAAELTKLDQLVKQPTAKKLIGKSLDKAAETTGQSRADLEEKSIPTYDLDLAGKLVRTFGRHTATLQLIASREVETQWTDENGKILKSVPSEVKKEHATELKKFQKLAKDIEKMLTAQRIRLERLLMTTREWDFTAWRQRYLDQPLLAGLSRRLIWHFKLGDRTALGAWLDGKLVDVDGRPLDWLAPETRVRLWHPIGFPVATVAAWREWLQTHQVCQPFKQAHREVYLLTDAELATETYSNRFAAHILGQHQFAALCVQRGWKYAFMGGFDSYNTPTLLLPQWNLLAEYWVNGVGELADSGVCLYVSTDQVRFVRDGQPLALTDVPATVFTEVMRDVDLFVGVCSIGANPAWHDQGQIDGGGNYWQSYSFGELNATAKTRREVLERLLPKLKIAARCSLQEKFLVVRGDVRTYNIHLGSGNIQMEPNNQYLCIVPAQGAAAKENDKVFLPFEGDRTLSVILSKAFMLAADTKIKDSGIVSQITLRK